MPTPDVNLINENWKLTSGVTLEDGQLVIAATSNAIESLNNGGPQENPPLNIMGSHLVAQGDFLLSASLRNLRQDATWTIYGRPPVIADEFRLEPTKLSLTLNGHDLEVSFFDGTVPQEPGNTTSAFTVHATVKNPEDALSVRQSGASISILSGNSKIAQLPDGKTISTGQLWLGFSSQKGSFRVAALSAAGIDGAKLSSVKPAFTAANPSVDGLQALASRVRPDFTIGAAVALGPLASDQQYSREFVGNFGALTPENSMKAQALSPEQGIYTFADADALLLAAERKGIRVHGHALAFSEAMPSWMQELPSETPTERSESAKALLSYIRTVMTHFKGKLVSLDVVNEPLDVQQGSTLQKNVWYRVFGSAYPSIVSKAVHDVDPSVKQFINENGAEVPGPRQDALLALAEKANAGGGYIHGIGLQSHVYDLSTDAISASDLEKTFARLRAVGLQARISEIDVTDAAGLDAQAKQYTTVLESCIASEVCESWTTWGVDDRYNWWMDSERGLLQGHDFLFNEGKATPAYESLKNLLLGLESEQRG